MGLVFAGIDEAGYGPMLGPLCVAATAFRVRDWAEGGRAPDLWARLASAVAPALTGRGDRIVVADSKKLKKANSTSSPLEHLQSAALAFLATIGRRPEDDGSYFAAVGAALPDRPWYGGPGGSVGGGAAAAISGNVLARTMSAAGVEFLGARCEVIDAPLVNRAIHDHGSKARATIDGVGRQLRWMAATWGDGPDAVRVACDRLGGRTAYAAELERELPGALVSVLDESPAVSRYEVRAGGATMGIQFRPEGEAAFLPVALASIFAKFTRELAMRRFNSYWCGRVAGLRPTAGYVADGRRWLAQVRPVLSPAERAELVRIG